MRVCFIACSVRFSGLLTRRTVPTRSAGSAEVLQLKCFSAQPPMLLPSLVTREAGRGTPMVTSLIAMGALLIAIVGGVLLNPDKERDEEREHAWPFF